MALAPDDPAVRYDRACMMAKERRFPEALEELGLAVAGEPSRRGMALADPDFDLLAADAEFSPQYRRLVGDGDGCPRKRGRRAN
jgi:hypothetical protein